jgi:CelD/BcsL family acetyltransferase involved in cellulose biosynthesis
MRVYVPNNRDYDLTSLIQYGETTIITDGLVNIFNLAKLRSIIKEVLKDSSEDDYVVMIGAPVINSLVAMHMMLKHGRVNLLLFNAKHRTYEVRTVTEMEVL